jgi:hypothetical protein
MDIPVKNGKIKIADAVSFITEVLLRVEQYRETGKKILVKPYANT